MNKTHQTKMQRGFTIVEVLLVIAVIGILAGISIVAYGQVRERAMDAKLEANASSIERGIRLKYAETGKVSPSPGASSADQVKQEYNIAELGDDVFLVVMKDENCVDSLSDDCDLFYGGPDDVDDSEMKGKVIVRVLDFSPAYSYDDGWNFRECTSGVVIEYWSHKEGDVRWREISESAGEYPGCVVVGVA